MSRLDGPLATLQVPADVGGANWPGGAIDPETNRLYIHSHTAVYAAALVAGRPCRRPISATWEDCARECGSGGAAAPGDSGGRGARGGGAAGAAPGAGRGRGTTTVRGLPLIKPPYDRITAYDMNTGDLIWQKPHSSTPDEIRNHPALKGLDLPSGSGNPGAPSSACSRPRSLLIAGEGGRAHRRAGKRVALLRAYDKATGADVGAVEMPAKQTGSPMTYLVNGRQYIVVAVSGSEGSELIAYALPRQ